MSPPASNGEGRVVIIGAGHAGGSVAALLRQYDFKGAITLVGDETIPPYQRPPLSKAWLKGEADSESLALRPEAWYADETIRLMTGETAQQIDRTRKTVLLSSGEVLSYEHLVLATGARARPLTIPGSELQGVLSLRTSVDAEALRGLIGPRRTLAIVGGGYVGLEVAASARGLGCDVILLEREDRLLARVACESLSDFFRSYHVERGVDFHFGVEIASFTGGHQVEGVQLADGTVVRCDGVLVGIGAVPNDELARECGLECGSGVHVDLDARTSDPAVFAIGDVTFRPVPLYSRKTRLESVPNALEQAKKAASAITGRAPPRDEVPWFWSDQYDLKLQIAGLPHDVDLRIVRGSVENAAFAVFHLKNEIIQAVEAVNSPAEFMAGRQLIAQRTPVSIDRLADDGVSMKTVAA